MNTITLCQELHSYLGIADDTRVKATYAIMENNVAQPAMMCTTGIKKN